MLSALSTGALALLLAAGELVARVASPERDADREEVRTLDEALRVQQGCMEVVGRELVPRAEPTDAAPARMPLARAPGVYRVAFVGESNARLLGEQVQELLASSPAGSRYQVLNCGVAGGAMELTMWRFREVLGYRPDAVVMIFGHNIQFSTQRESVTRLRLQRLRAHSRLLTRLLGGADPSGSHGAEGGPPVLLDPWVEGANAPTSLAVMPDDATTDPIERRRALFRMMVRHMVVEARARGVKLVVSTMASNHLMPPTASREDLDDPTLQTAELLSDVGRRAEAGDDLAATLAQHPVAYAQFRLAELRLAGDDLPAALEGFERAVAMDPRIPRATAAQNAWLRATAAQEGAALLDPERALTARAPRGVLGFETFNDCCHYVPSVEREQAAALLTLVRSVVDDRAAPTTPLAAPVEDDVVRFLDGELGSIAQTGDDAYLRQRLLDLPRGIARLYEQGGDAIGPRALAALEYAMTRAPAERRALALQALAEGASRAGREPFARSLNAQAVAAAPGAGARVQQARFALRAGHIDEARATLRQAAQAPGATDEAAGWLAELDRLVPPP